jgi:glucokinase
MGIAAAVAVTSPEAVFLFGGLAKSGKYILEPTKKYMEQYMLKNFRNKIKLLPSGIDSANAAILGASALAWQKYQNSRRANSIRAWCWISSYCSRVSPSSSYNSNCSTSPCWLE